MSNTQPVKPIVLSYKQCFVPKCQSSTSRTPLKVFIPVPKDSRTRKEWCNAAGCSPNDLRPSASICEDHFNLSEDLINYPYWKLLGGPRLIKRGSLPRFFACQNVASLPEISCHDAVSLPLVDSHEDTLNAVDPLATTENDSTSIFVCSLGGNNMEEFILPDNLDTFEQTGATINSRVGPKTLTRGTQTRKLETSQKLIQVEPKTTSIGTCTTSFVENGIRTRLPLREENEKDTPIKVEDVLMDIIDEKPTDDEVTLDPSDSEMNQNTETERIPTQPETCSMDIVECKPDDTEIILDPCNGEIIRSVRERSVEAEKRTESEKRMLKLKKTIYEETTRLLIEDNPFLFLGLTKEHLSVIDGMSRSSRLSKRHIHTVLHKIRHNVSNSILLSLFGFSEWTITPIIVEGMEAMANYCERWINWPPNNEIRLNLPLIFTERYGRVHSIIDTFDIHVDELNLPKKRSVGDNIRKYLISITPDGFINYVSSGYNGTLTDIQIIENSDYLSHLPDGSAVLADRSYKIIELLMQKKRCTLIRPPIVLIDLKSTERKKTTIPVNSVRDYVQKTVRQLRDFKFLEHHRSLRADLFDHLDQAVIIAAGLLNLQKTSSP